MAMISKILLTVLMLIFVPLCVANAAKERFFEALYDVPIMDGMEEVPGEALLFDKPDGKIASATGAVSDSSIQKVSDFYAQTLPQMGWKKTSPDQYVRGQDRLTIRFEQRPGITAAFFTLEPAVAAASVR